MVDTFPEQPKRWWESRWVAWTLVGLGGLERLIGWGGSIDFILARWDEPAWVGTMTDALAHYSNWIGLALLIGGIVLLIRAERNRNDALYGPAKALVEDAPDLVEVFEQGLAHGGAHRRLYVGRISLTANELEEHHRLELALKVGWIGFLVTLHAFGKEWGLLRQRHMPYGL